MSRALTLLVLILAAFMWSSLTQADEVCSFIHRTDGSVLSPKTCLQSPAGKSMSPRLADFIVSPEVLQALDFKDGLAVILHANGFLYVNKQGVARKVLTFDNGPDYFEEGLARTIDNGKIGFFDRNLKLAIPPQYDFAFPFQNGCAIVCNGCKSIREGEHSYEAGGTWGKIDHEGHYTPKN